MSLPDSFVDLPPYIDEEIWGDWIAMRNEKKYPVNERQQKAALRVLKRGLEEGHDPNKMLDLAINGGWQGLFTNESTVKKVRPASHGEGPKYEPVEINREQGRAALALVKGAIRK